MKISVDFDNEKLEAVKFSLEKSGQSVEQELVSCLQKLYEKSVPTNRNPAGRRKSLLTLGSLFDVVIDKEKPPANVMYGVVGQKIALSDKAAAEKYASSLNSQEKDG